MIQEEKINRFWHQIKAHGKVLDNEHKGSKSVA